MRSSLALLVSVTASTALAETLKIGDLAQGSEFKRCIKQSDFHGSADAVAKGLGDEVEVVDREDGGCCPDGFVPGYKHTASYYGPMIVCGFQEDGTLKFSTGTSNGVKTCTYNKCFVIKSDVSCTDDTKMALNGCCAKGKWPGTGNDECKNYDKTPTSNGVVSRYCTHYNSKYKMEGTADKADDIVTTDGKSVLDLSKLYVYTACKGALSGDGGSDSDGSSSTSSASPFARAAMGAMSVFGAFMMA